MVLYIICHKYISNYNIYLKCSLQRYIKNLKNEAKNKLLKLAINSIRRYKTIW